MKLRIISIASALLLVAQGASAIPFAEIGDAGDNLAGAQTVGAGTTSITGNGGSLDVDMFSFSWNGGGLQIDTFYVPFTYDTQLFLFDSGGNGVLGNDDHGGACTGTPGSGLQSCLDLSGGLAAGSYYLGISAFNNDPLDAANVAMMSCSPFSSQCGASGGALDSWTGGSTTPGNNAYTINFSAAVSVPEPGTLLLLGMGLIGLGAARIKRA